MNILFTRFPLESAYGGAEVQTLSLMRGLRERGHTVVFMGSCPVLLAESERAGFAILPLNIGPPPVSPLHAFSFAWRRLGMQRKLIAAYHSLNDATPVDAVCMLSLSEKLLLTDHAADHGKVLWIEHDRIGRWLTKNPWLTQLRRLSQRATTVCVSLLSRKMYEELGWANDRVVDIPNGIDPARFDSSVAPRQSSQFTAGCIARLTPDKGVDVLLEAVTALPDVQLRIVGQGREEAALRSLIAARSLTNRVTVEPNAPDLSSWYRSIDILVLPSREHDPFGLVAAEAMLFGVPVIVTEVCGIAGYLQNGVDALVVPANDPPALTQAIMQLQSADVRQKIGAAGQKKSERDFALEPMISRYETLLR